MSGITYLKGDATCPQGKGVKIICHVCNDIGGWGEGFVLAISKRWKEPQAEYRKWHAAGKESGFALGAVQFVQVEPYIWVANMVGQRGIKRGSSGADSLRGCGPVPRASRGQGDGAGGFGSHAANRLRSGRRRLVYGRATHRAALGRGRCLSYRVRFRVAGRGKRARRTICCSGPATRLSLFET
jgi:hypothetical protein